MAIAVVTAAGVGAAVGAASADACADGVGVAAGVFCCLALAETTLGWSESNELQQQDIIITTQAVRGGGEGATGQSRIPQRCLLEVVVDVSHRCLVDGFALVSQMQQGVRGQHHSQEG